LSAPTSFWESIMSMMLPGTSRTMTKNNQAGNSNVGTSASKRRTT